MRVLGETDPRLERYRDIVRAVVSKYNPRGELGDDLQQEAWLALWRARDRIDTTRGTAEAYVSRLAKGAVQHYFRDRYAMIHLPRWKWEAGDRPPEVLSLDALEGDDEEGGILELERR